MHNLRKTFSIFLSMALLAGLVLMMAVPQSALADISVITTDDGLIDPNWGVPFDTGTLSPGDKYEIVNFYVNHDAATPTQFCFRWETADTPTVTLSNDTHFSETDQPGVTNIVNSAAATFAVAFDPAAAGSFTDTLNIANNSDESQYSFVISSTGTAAPVITVTGVSPAAGSHDAALDATLAITLSGDIQQGSVTTETVFVHGGGHGQMDGAISFGSILYDPADDFFPGELVQTSVTAGVLADGGAPITPYVWQFRAASGVGPATFPTCNDSFGVGASTSVALGDVDGDGHLDAIIANWDQAQEIWLNDGTGAFGAAAHDSFGAGNSYDVALGDVDGDGDLDAVIANYNAAQEIWLNDGTGAFGAAAHDSFGAGYSYAVALGDVDGDGDLDAIISNENAAQEIWLNDGTGAFGTVAHDSFGAGDSTSVALGDVDGDGDLDAVIANFRAAQEVWLNDGTGAFGAAAHAIFGAGNSQSLVLGDVDGDGDLDTVIANFRAAQEVWLNDGTGAFGAAAHDSFGAGYSMAVALGDMDGDGDLDAVIANKINKAQEVWLNDGTGTFGAAAHDSFGAGSSRSVALGDMDGDGDLDAVIANYSTAQEVWLNHPVYADLDISQSIELNFVSAITFTITVENLGPDAADGALVTTSPSANITNATWTCTSTGGAVCSAASGNGDLVETLGAFPSGGTVTYVVSGDLGEWSQVSNSAEVTSPAGVIDPDLSNNKSTVGRYSVFLPSVFKNHQP